MSRSRRNAAAIDYFTRAPNYSAEAIAFLRDGEDNPEILALADTIESAHKFILPYGGALFDHVTETMLGEMHPPFERTVFEFDGPRPHVIVVAGAKDESGPLLGVRWLSRESDGWHLAENMWGADGTTFVASGPAVDPINDPTILAPLVVAAQACAALACTNVTTEVIRPNREARAARPASTLFAYHVLVIDPGAARERGECYGGTHAAPRTHLRRGHIRHHPTAGNIWVNSCIVNPGALGVVDKDYVVKRLADRPPLPTAGDPALGRARP